MATTHFSWTKGKKGDFLVRGPEGHSGEQVIVSKKNGGTSTVTLGKQVWSGDGVALYALPPKA
jgi:hypothetical protein